MLDDTKPLLGPIWDLIDSSEWEIDEALMLQREAKC
jgi:hypothetical protein